MSEANINVFNKLKEMERKYGKFEKMSKKQKEEYLKILSEIQFDE